MPAPPLWRNALRQRARGARDTRALRLLRRSDSTEIARDPELTRAVLMAARTKPFPRRAPPHLPLPLRGLFAPELRERVGSDACAILEPRAMFPEIQSELNLFFVRRSCSSSGDFFCDEPR